MHNFLTGFTETDHVNGDGLDNRRCNLREATRSQNLANRIKVAARNGVPASSRFKGVWLDRTSGKWVAETRLNGKKRSLGRFTDEVEAARAYDKAALELFGDFAKTNEMLGLL